YSRATAGAAGSGTGGTARSRSSSKSFHKVSRARSARPPSVEARVPALAGVGHHQLMATMKSYMIADAAAARCIEEPREPGRDLVCEVREVTESRRVACAVVSDCSFRAM